MWENWVADVTLGGPPWCFIPIEDDGTLVVGMNFLGTRPRGNFVGIVHLDGQQACDDWIAANPNGYEELVALAETQ